MLDAPDDAWELLGPLLTEVRQEKLLQAINNRTEHLTLVIQDVHQPHNISACFRSAEAFGIQNIHVVTLGNNFKASTVARGVDRWVTAHRHDSVRSCVESLKNQGYLIGCALPKQDSLALGAIDINPKTALVFGNEKHGVDQEWLDHADFCFTIPMVGLVESLNISVSAAVTLHHLTQKARQSLGPRYFLASEKQKKILNLWAYQQTTRADDVLKRLRH